MLNRGKSKYVDGLVTLRATQLHGREKRYSTRTETEPDNKEKTAAGAKPGAARSMGIGRTVMPTQNEIVCYACGFHFVMRGRAEYTQCPKCGARLSLKDEKITGGFRDELVTAGKVTLTRSAIVDGGTIQTSDLAVEGIIKSGQIKVFRTLELLEGSEVPEDLINTRHLRIGPGASYKLKKPLQIEDLVVEGTLEGKIKATGHVFIKATGHLIGAIETAHLEVEDGAGLSAACKVAPPAPEPTEEEVDEEQPPDDGEKAPESDNN